MYAKAGTGRSPTTNAKNIARRQTPRWSGQVSSKFVPNRAQPHLQHSAPSRMPLPDRTLRGIVSGFRLVRRSQWECVSSRTQSTRRSEEHTSELQSLMRISYAVFCLKKKKTTDTNNKENNQTHIHNHNQLKT